jgi:VWFA-related protein
MKRSFILSLLLAGLAPAQEPPTFRTGVQVVVVPAVVTDSEGNYVNGLQPQDFRLTDNGQPQRIQVDVTYVPISLVVAIQASSATESVLPKIQKIGSLLQGLVTGEQGEVAILAFDHRIQTLQDFTSDTDKIEEALKKLRAGSSSSRLTDAVVTSARMLNHRPPHRRRVLLLISETRDRGSEARVRDALTDLQFDNVSVYSVNINRAVTTLLAKPEPPPPDSIPFSARPLPAGMPSTPSSAEQVAPVVGKNAGNAIPAFVELFRQAKAIFVANPVEVYTQFTGGKEHSFVSQRDLERAIAGIGNELHSEYLITYAPGNKEEGGFHDIAVTVNRRDAKVRTRPGYWVATRQ